MSNPIPDGAGLQYPNYMAPYVLHLPKNNPVKEVPATPVVGSASQDSVITRQPRSIPIQKRHAAPPHWTLNKNQIIPVNTSLAEEMYHFVDRGQLWQVVHELPSQRQALRQVAVDCAIACYPYKLSIKAVHRAENLSLQSDEKPHCHYTPLRPGSPEFDSFWQQLNQLPQLKGHLKVQGALMVDTSSGMVASVFKDTITGSVKLVFGGTNSGLHSDDPETPASDTFSTRTAQVTADIVNFSGFDVPISYRQADLVTQVAVETFGRSNLSLTGHSLGGGLAQYCAAANGVPANCYSSAALGEAALVELVKKSSLNPEWIKENIQQYMVYGDVICAPVFLELFNKQFAATNLHFFSAQTWSESDPLIGRHSRARNHIMTVVENELSAQS